ncbi:LCP family protein [Paenibacillus sp. NEAU-GSW1]|uniref:LCP family protein n=1 Tax=Paenibacillus sp. NEAU-GSW1 TaxID=2682486 RepID=UPI0012E0F0CD|nr:LCP family protein [Paenibacillus sp. NEAU-GSW1]MUT65591.1 LytR family transcriptional regulator [Paenibacillus sp. NEAU-GSW1]
MRSQPKKKRSLGIRILVGVLVILALIIAGIIVWGSGVYKGLDSFSKTKEESRFGQFEEKPELAISKWEGKERVNILLLGADARGLEEDQVARSDSMMVASFDPVTKKAHLFSVLRDTYVEIDGHGDGRINTAITLGGPQLAMKSIGDLLGLDIQYYVYTDFEGFKALIDAIGGVSIDVEKDMHYTDNADNNEYDIDLKAGYQELDGDKALQYVRFRHDAMSDFTRTERQRNLLQAVAKELQSSWNIIKMKNILESVSPYIETNLQVTDMLKLGQLGVESHVAGTAQVPPMDLIADEKVGGASVLAVRDDAELLAFVQETLAADQTLPSPSPSADAEDGSASTNSGSNTSQ